MRLIWPSTESHSYFRCYFFLVSPFKTHPVKIAISRKNYISRICYWPRGKKLIAIKAIIDNHWQSCINLLIEPDCHFAKWWKQEVISEKAKIHYLIMKIAKAIVGNHWQSLTICANHWQSLQVKKIIFRLTSEPVIAILFRNDNRMYFQKILELVIG